MVTLFAGFWGRAAAFALDYLIILGYLLGITLLFALANTLFDVSGWLFGERLSAQLTAFLLVTLPVTLYFAASESSPRQGTWGKQRLRLKVADHNGKRISFLRAFGRTLLKFVPWEISHTLVWTIYFSPGVNSVWTGYGFALVYLLIGLNILSLFITRKNQTLYDLLTHTYVIASR